MARAFQLFIEMKSQDISGEPVNIGFNNQNFQVKEIVEFVHNSWPHGCVKYRSDASSDPRDYMVNFSLFESIFPKFKPIYPLKIGVVDLKDFLVSIGYSKAEHDDCRFVRLIELKKRIGEL